MQLTGTSLGTIQLDNYELKFNVRNGGSVYDKLENSTWTFTAKLTKTKAPRVTLSYLVGTSGGSSIANLKSMMMNREALTATDNGFGAFIFYPLNVDVTQNTGENTVMRAIISGVVTSWS